MIMYNFETPDEFLNDNYSESIEEITEKIYFIEKSHKYYHSEPINRTFFENESKELFIENNNAIIILSSNHDKNSINNQNNDDDLRYFTKTKEESNSKKVKIFSITKKQKRKNKLDANKKNESKNSHNKYSEDNLVTKVKTYFVNSLREYINIKYSELKKGKQKLLKKISPIFSKAYSKKNNQSFLQLKVKQFVSMEISKRCRDSPDHNEKQIEILYQQKESNECTELLDYSLSKAYELYISNEKKEFSLEQDLKKLKEKKKEKDDYIKEFEKTAKNLIEILSRRGIIKNKKFLCIKRKPSKKNKINYLKDLSDDTKSGSG